MESNYRSFNPPYQVTDQEDRENSFESGGDSPPSTTFGTSTTSCLKRSRRAIEKRVVTIPMKDVDRSRFKGDFTPPSDSWAWRKYGQKPIKGSPYPRGYYRCSSSKGCPARKQVERSRLDPNMLVVAYSYEHNHPWPATSKHHRNNHHNATARSTPATTSLPNPSSPKLEEQSLQAESPQRHPIKLEQYREEAEIFSNPRDNDKFTHLGDEPLVTSDEFGWFSTDVASTSSSSVAGFGGFGDLAIGEYFPMGEEEGSLFADLGELPECSVVFRHREAAVAATATVEEEAEQQRCSLMPAWFGATG